MKTLDRVLQRWRIREVTPWLRSGARVLDIGTADGALFTIVSRLEDGVGLDPDLSRASNIRSNRLLPGLFPDALPDARPFDAITMLAVLEHIPTAAQQPLAKACFAALTPGGHVLITVPSPVVDKILAVLTTLRLVSGMSLEQHYGFDITQTPALFGSAGFELVKWRRFQLGVNNLFVFRKPA
jgi:SAM-dependent methyltransferase